MAKEKMITREVVTTVFTVMGMSKETEEVEYVEGRVPGKYTLEDEAKLFKYITNSAEFKGFVPIKIDGLVQEKALYGMPVKLFIDMAQPLPPRKEYNGEE